MIYVDTSAVVAVLAREPLADTLQDWISRQPAGTLCVSAWVSAEFSSALAIKMRRGEYSRQSRDAVLAEWRNLLRASFNLVPVLAQAFALAADLINDPNSVLRAGDALHLAVALLGGHSLATLDNRMARAAVRARVSVEQLA